jgi:hypothetical protein
MLRRRNRTFGRQAIVFFSIFLIIGWLIGLSASGVPPRDGRWIAIVAIFGVFGSKPIWMWIAFKLQRPMKDIVVSEGGLVVHDTVSKEPRYRWSDPMLQIALQPPLATENAPVRTSSTDRRIQIRPPAAPGRLSDDCYEALTRTARRAGLSVADRRF